MNEEVVDSDNENFKSGCDHESMPPSHVAKHRAINQKIQRNRDMKTDQPNAGKQRSQRSSDSEDSPGDFFATEIGVPEADVEDAFPLVQLPVGVVDPLEEIAG